MILVSHNGCGNQKNVPISKFHILIPGTSDFSLTWQRDVARVVKLRVLRWGEDPSGP